jgi:hypothetical protein
MRLGDVLDEARHRTFVGHDAELTRFDDALAPVALRLNARAALLLEPAAQIFSDPAAVARVQALGASAPRYPLPGPSRAEVLAVIGA